MELRELSDEQLANMPDDEYRQKSRKMDRNLKKATDERRASAMKLLKQDAPQTKIVNDEEGKPVEVQTNTDTKDPNKVPDTLGGKIPNESGKPEGEITEQTSNAEKVINDVERGENPSEIGKAQIKAVWGGDIGSKEGGETEENKNKETTEEKPTNKPTEEKEKEVVIKYVEKQKDALKRYLRSGILRDYRNGLFGDISTPEGRKDARSLATHFIVNKIGTFLANISNGYFGRPMVNSAYKDLLQEQESALTKLGVERYGEQNKRNIAEDWANLSPEERERVVQGSALRQLFLNIDINNTPTVSRWLSDPMLQSFGTKVAQIDDEEVRKAIINNEQLLSIISNLKANTKKIGVDTNLVEEAVVAQAIKNKHLNTKELLENVDLALGAGGKLLKAVGEVGSALLKP